MCVCVSCGYIASYECVYVCMIPRLPHVDIYVRVCVRERERERERVSVSVCVYIAYLGRAMSRDHSDPNM